MRRAFVVVGEKLSGTWRNDGALVILASECLYRLNVSELGYHDEFDFVVGGVASHQVRAGVPSDAVNAGQDVGAEQLFVFVRVLSFSPAVPDSAAHVSPPALPLPA